MAAAPRVHYEIEPWHLGVVGGVRSGFPLGGAEAKAGSIDQLFAKYQRAKGRFGHAASYYVNRVTTVHLLEYNATPRGAEPDYQEPVRVAPVSPPPAVGDVEVAYVVRDLTSNVEIAVLADRAEARRTALALAGHGRPMGVDLTVVERLGLFQQGAARPAWDSVLLGTSRAPELVARVVGDDGLAV